MIAVGLLEAKVHKRVPGPIPRAQIPHPYQEVGLKDHIYYGFWYLNPRGIWTVSDLSADT